MRPGVLACAAALCLLLAGCVQYWRLPGESAPSTAEELFDRGMAELAAGGETRFFQTLHREYPASAWTSRAHAVLALLKDSAVGTEQELARRGQRASRVEEEIARLRVEVEVLTEDAARLREERDRLKAESGPLSVKLDQLRAEHAHQGGELERLGADNAQLLRELDRLRADNTRLLGDLEQLKNLTIEMELKR
ncbi:MAG TPA: hypothetical protein VK997_15165 [Deferrisomatales bacterium]|nr:hypothetical protein [Deferrisomatales bacterium]